MRTSTVNNHILFASYGGCRDNPTRPLRDYRDDLVPPGPAYIPMPNKLPWPYESREQWVKENVPVGYVWQPATDWTGPGWVRK